MEEAFGAPWYRLGWVGEMGCISCDERGAFVGAIPLLAEMEEASSPRRHWTPRPVAALNGALSAAYGLPVDMAAKQGGLVAVAGALNAGNLTLARIATLHLQLPDPPPLEKAARSREEMVVLAGLLHRSGILKLATDRAPGAGDASKRDVSGEPRIPRGQTGGGRWATEGAVVPVQELIIRPAPFDAPFPYPLRPPLPFPGRPPVPLDIPDGAQRDGIPVNPYPDRPECADEWASATERCREFHRKGVLGARDYRGMGKNLFDCIMGQVSEECGGNSTGA